MLLRKTVYSHSGGHTDVRDTDWARAAPLRLSDWWRLPRGPRVTPALYPVNETRYYNATLHQRYNATLHHTNARHTAPVWRPTCSTERQRRQQSAAPAGATDAHKLHYSFIMNQILFLRNKNNIKNGPSGHARPTKKGSRGQIRKNFEIQIFEIAIWFLG